MGIVEYSISTSTFLTAASIETSGYPPSRTKHSSSLLGSTTPASGYS